MLMHNGFTVGRRVRNTIKSAAVRRAISAACSILTIVSMLLSSFPAGALLTASPAHAAAGAAQAPSRTYRAQVKLKHPYDATRLAELGLTLYDQTDDQATVFADKQQLATLARRGFEPRHIVAVGTLSQLAEGQLNTAAPTELDAPDSDADGLTDQEEIWWCTDPNDNNSDSSLPPSPTNPSDGDEVQAILSGITAYGPPFALWPQFTPYNPGGTCPDGDFDGVPDEAEELMIGTSQLRESSDKDKFDDGQELFGVTFCPAPSGPCGYGILPRAEDTAFVTANLPAWVLPPGDSPWVAAFPQPEVEVVPSSIKVAAVTTIETERTITEGEEHTYGTSETTGVSTSVADTITWNEWQEISESISDININQSLGAEFNSSANSSEDSVNWGQMGLGGLKIIGGYGAFAAGCVTESVHLTLGVLYGVDTGGKGLCKDGFYAGNEKIKEGWRDIKDTFGQDDVQNNKECDPDCSSQIENLQIGDSSAVIDDQAPTVADQNLKPVTEGTQYFFGSNSELLQRVGYEITYPTLSVPSNTTGHGKEYGGAKTTTHTEYQEQTISESSTNQFSESWSNATAIDTAHAADLRFTYNIVNNGTEYAREVTSLLFNIYIGDDPNPAYTYVAVGTTGQIAVIENLFPGESLNFTSDPIPLNLEEMQAIDEGALIRVVLEDIAFGQDQVFYQDALNGSVLVAMEDGFDDSDETVDTYLIPVWDPSDTVQDVLNRYFPATEDEDGDLLSISTLEFDTNPPVFNDHALTGTSWWNMYLSDGLDYTGDFKTTLAQPNTTVLIRILSDRDLDGYNDRNEIRLGTDPDDPASHPNPELLAGYTTDCSGNDCTVLMSFLNTGNYDAYGVEAIMYSPDGLTDITNNTIGGSGRAPAGRQVVLGTRILPPDLTGWTGGGQPYSSGFYLGNIDRTYSFTATTSGNIGAGSLNFDWSDDQGASGMVDFGAAYQAPLPVTIDQGLQISFQTGSVNQGKRFTVQALTPRDTFQYTITDPGYVEPVIVVSYNDPQGNHRFILPSTPYPAGSQLTDLNADLQPLSGQMLPDPGVDIAATGGDQVHFILNAPHPSPISDGHLFVEYIDVEGNVDQEDVFTQTLETGPTIIPVTVDTNVYTPTDYILLAFMTDSQGNIIDSSARPLASFGPDPLPIANLTAGEWQVGTMLEVMNVPDPWDFGTVEAGTLLNAQLTLANTGLGSLRYALTGLGSGVSVEGAAAGTLISPTETRVFNLTVDTAGYSPGPFNHTLTLRTNDPNNASIAINLAGTIEGTPAGGGTAFQVNIYRPWDQYIAVPGPHNINDTIVFSYTITNEAVRMHPLYLYTEDESTLKGIGEFGVDFSRLYRE